MRIAILGANSHIAGDLIYGLSKDPKYQLYLFSRRLPEMHAWLAKNELTNRHFAAGYDVFHRGQYDVIINFVGAGCPIQVQKMGNSIIEVTKRFDLMVIDYLEAHSNCKYIFISSGAVHDELFDNMPSYHKPRHCSDDQLSSVDWYGLSKKYAEENHRKLQSLSIVDIRVFSYFSHTQRLDTHFLMSDVIHALYNNSELVVSNDVTVRDYLHREDFYQIIEIFIHAEHLNDAIDCYTRSPVEKIQLLDAIKRDFGLRYSVEDKIQQRASRSKSYYYSDNHRAESFGYFPKWGSLNSVISEVSLLLNR